MQTFALVQELTTLNFSFIFCFFTSSFSTALEARFSSLNLKVYETTQTKLTRLNQVKPKQQDSCKPNLQNCK